MALMHQTVQAQPRKLTIIALGPLTNVARLLEQHPEDKAMIQRIVLMGGAIEVGYNGKAPAESNDTPARRKRSRKTADAKGAGGGADQ